MSKKQLIKLGFSKQHNSKKQGKIFRAFAGAISPRGIVSYINELTEKVDMRFILMGKPGVGKSAIMKKCFG